MELKIPLADLDYGPDEENAALEVIHNGWLTMGRVTQEFEAEFRKMTGSKYAFAVSNCTQALHLAYLALGVGPGDEIILPSLTFVATANAALYTGAEVRFADVIGEHELTVAPEDIERKLTPRTKGVAVVHYGGFPCRMPEILEIAKRNYLWVIEDAAHAPGAALENRSLGAWGDVGCFSFFANKNLATGEGGMLVTDRDDVAEKVKLLRSHGMTTLTWDRHQGHAFTYDVVELGYNDRIDEIRSALGLVQLAKLTKNNARRKAITERYWRGLAEPAFKGIELPFRYAPGVSSYHLLPILLPAGVDRRFFMDAMREQGVQTSIHYPPVHRFSYYRRRYPGISLPVTEAAAEREVTLPLYPGMTDADVDFVLAAVSASLAKAADRTLAFSFPQGL